MVSTCIRIISRSFDILTKITENNETVLEYKFSPIDFINLKVTKF